MGGQLENLMLQEKRDAAYVIAQRHSVLITKLRIAVPAAAFGLTFALGLALTFLRPGAVAQISGIQLDRLTIDNGNLVMANPRLEGVADGNRPYLVQAERAVQAGPTADLIELENITGEVSMDADLTGTLNAVSGVFERAANRLRLTDQSTFTRSDGIEAFFEEADIDVGAGSLTSDRPVRVRQGGQEIIAGSASFTENGRRLVFDDGVTVTVQPTSGDEDAGAAQ